MKNMTKQQITRMTAMSSLAMSKIPVAVVGLLLAGVLASCAELDDAATEAAEEVQTDGEISSVEAAVLEGQGANLLAPCGESIRSCSGNFCVDYRHCTSGSDSVRVRAIIGLGADGPCTTVGPNQTKVIWIYGGISFFDHIARC